MANLRQDCDIMIDQIRSIDNKRLMNKVGVLQNHLIELVKENIKIVIDME